jgi:hypothetical protein
MILMDGKEEGNENTYIYIFYLYKYKYVYGHIYKFIDLCR